MISISTSKSQAKARLVMIVPVFPQISETFIVQKFLSLLERGWDVHVVCSRSQGDIWHHFPQLREKKELLSRVHVTWPAHTLILAGLLFPFVFLRCILLATRLTLKYLSEGWKQFGPDILRRFYIDAELILLQPDAIHFEFGALAVGREYLKDLLKSRMLVSFRGYDLNFSGLRSSDYFHKVWEQADALHLLSESLWTAAKKQGCPIDKPHVLIPPAINLSFLKSNGKVSAEVVGTVSHPYRILSVGRLEWKKGYDYGLQAIKWLVDQGLTCEYRIVGDGSYKEAILFERHDLELDHVVELLGSQPHHEVKSLLQWADVFLHPSMSEGFCNAVLEAQAMAVPVVCTDAGGLPENVIDGRTGFVVPRRNWQMMAERLTLLASNPELRLQMGRAGQERVREHFGYSSQLAHFDEFYRQALHGTG